MKKLKTYYYYTDDDFQFRKVPYFRLKIASFIAVCVFVCLGVILSVNHYYYDFLGIGYDQIRTLRQENAVLTDRFTALMGELQTMDKTIAELNSKGNELRLAADLPELSKDQMKAGTGGALGSVDVDFLSDNMGEVLRSASSMVEKLRNETSVQEQNYRDVARKMESNKGYFASMPALKPMDGYYSTNGFGLRMHPVLGVFKLHEGLDIINDVGTPVYATGNGTVEFAGQSGGGFGIVVVINHGYGFQTLYAHLSKAQVREGQHVRRGELIAKSGRTGLVSGPHLHYEVHYKGVRQNPVDYFLDDVHPQEYLQQFAHQ